jgi:hypothetical protein
LIALLMKWPQLIVYALLLLLLGATGWGWYQWQGLRGRVMQPLASDSVMTSGHVPDSGRAQVRDWTRWETGAPFAVAGFQRPERRYHPWIRWWWPGLAVQPLELQREIQALGKSGFGGMAIEVTTAGLAPTDQQPVNPARWQPDAPRLHYLLQLVMCEAHKREMAIDWMSPLGWPLGGHGLAPEAQLQTLAYGEAHIRGGKRVRMSLPPPSLPAAYYLGSYLAEHVLHEDHWLHFPPDAGRVLAVYAGKALDDQRNPLTPVLIDYLTLDPDSLLPLNSFVRPGGLLDWQAPPGYWEILVVYQRPVGQQPLWGGSQAPLALANPFDREAMQHVVTQLGQGPADDTLPPSAQAWRGLSYSAHAWLAEQAFDPVLIDSFVRRAGYDLPPLLPVLAYPGRDNLLLNQLNPLRSATYRLTEADDRIRHDYQQVKSDFLIERGLRAQVAQSHALGYLHRGRPYGLDWDLIRAAGQSDVPTASQTYAGGSELFLKQISSGGMLYGRTLIACDALMHPGQAGAMTPPRLKLAADKLFTAGFNQVEWQGFAYQVADSARYGTQGWQPFASPYVAGGAFSSQLGPSSPLWPHWPQLNRYVARCQYALQQGEPGVDVLVYYPFLGFPAAWAGERTHHEDYFNGLMPVVDDTVPLPWQPWPAGLWERDREEARMVWLRKVWPTLQVLENLGYTWAWVNDDLLQQADFTEGQLMLRGQPYGMVFLPEVTTTPLPTLEKLVSLARAGAPVWLYGESPQRQPGYANYRSHDSLIQRLTRELQPALSPENVADLRNLLLASPPPQGLAYAGYYPFLRHARRRLPNGGELWFLRNVEEKDRFFELSVLQDYDHFYWLNPENGACYPIKLSAQGRVRGFLGGYATLLLYAHQGAPLPDSLLQAMPLLLRGPNLRDKLNEHTLSSWQFIARDPRLAGGQLMLNDTSLFDWRAVPALQNYTGEGLYTHTFELTDTLPERHYLLDLGQVADVAEVRLNTHNLGTQLYPPYRLDVTPYLVPGANTLEVWLRPSLRNTWVGLGKQGWAAYAPYASLPRLPAGLLGPVRLIELQP